MVATKEKKRNKRKRKRKEKKSRQHYYKIITVLLLLSDSFMEGKGPSIIFKECNKVTQRLPIRIPIVVISSTLIKDMTS